MTGNNYGIILGFLKVYVSVFGSYEMMYARCYAHRANAKVQRGC